MTDLTTHKAALLARDAAFAAEASTGGDVEKVVSYWTEAAVVTPPGQPAVVGRAALRKYVHDSYSIPGFRITWEATADPEFAADLTMAYLWGRNTVSSVALTVRSSRCTAGRSRSGGTSPTASGAAPSTSGTTRHSALQVPSGSQQLVSRCRPSGRVAHREVLR